MKALIIDDDPYTRDGIRRKVDWKGIGIDAVEEAEDGEAGIERARRFLPDIAICDISMPRKNGIACANGILSFVPSCKIIFLSGYSDKEYLKSAIRLQAVDYLEKPLDPAELRSALDKTVRLIRKERQAAPDCFSLIHRFGHEEIGEKLQAMGCRFPAQGTYRAVAVKLTFQTKPLPEPLLEPVKEVWLESMKRLTPHVVAGYSDDGLLIAYVCMSKQFNNAELNERLRQSMSAVKFRFPACRSLTVGIGAEAAGLPQIRMSEKSAIRAIRQEFIVGPDRLIAVDREPEAPGCGDIEDFNVFLSCVAQGAFGDAMEVLHSFRRKCERSLPLDVDVIKSVFANTMHKLFELAGERGWMHAAGDPDHQARFDELKALPSLEEWIRYAEELLSEAVSPLEDAQSPLIRKIIAIMNKHYNEGSILDKIARIANMNSAYLSVMFKKNTGMTVLQYVTKVRLDKAAALLKDPTVRIQEIAQMVGYQDHNYFTRLFRKHTGCSPSEYRERMCR